jgi:hypothetical protein
MLPVSFAADLRISAATVNDDGALDGCSVVVIYTHFARAPPEAPARAADGLLLCIGRCKRWRDAGSLKRNPRALELLAGQNFRQRDEKMVRCSLFRLAGPKK